MSTFPPVRDELARLLSQPRLAPYKAAAGGQLEPALRLYTWNVEVGAAFFESLHYFEVAFRNTTHDALSTWASTLPGGSSQPGGSGRWYDHPAVSLNPGSHAAVRTAIRRATDDGRRAELPGRVVAELSLGFWGGLLADGYNRSLWQPCLQHAFPGARRRALHDAVDELRRLRNRIAHHEPLHTRDLAADYATLLGTAERIAPRLSWWIDTTSRVPTVFGRRP